MTDQEQDRRITIAEAADLLGIYGQSLRKIVASGRIKGERNGREWRVYLSSVLQYRNTKGGQVNKFLQREPITEGTDLDGTYRGKVLPAVRESGIGVNDFARRMQVDPAFLYMVDAGKRNASPAYRCRAARLLGLPQSELFEKVEDRVLTSGAA